MNNAVSFYRDHAGQRVSIRVKIAKHANGQDRSYTQGDARYATLQDEHGVVFSGRIPQFGLNSRDFREATAKIHHISLDGTVYLKNVRLKREPKVEIDEDDQPVSITLTKAQARVVLAALSRRCIELETLGGVEATTLGGEAKAIYQSVDKQVYGEHAAVS